MTVDYATMRSVADAYTAAWNSGSADAVAEFYAADGQIVINRGEPWNDVDAHGKVASSRGWYDAEDYRRQTGTT